jgi:hypothetical protein
MSLPIQAFAVSPSKLVSTQITIVDSKGFPLEYGEYTWKTVDGLAKSSKPIPGTALGVVQLNSVPSQEVDLLISRAMTTQGFCVFGIARITPQVGSLKISLPEYEAPVSRKVKVELPGGYPVPNTRVRSDGLWPIAKMEDSNFKGSISGTIPHPNNKAQLTCGTADFYEDGRPMSHNGSRSQYDGARKDGITLAGLSDSNGLVTLRGWNVGEPIKASALFDDGVLNQETTYIETASDSTTKITLNYFPILQTSSDDIDAYMNELVSLPVSVVDSAELEPMSLSRLISEPRASRASLVGKPSAAFAGVQVEVVSPANSKASKCTKKQTLKAKTTSSGKALLKVCVTTSGNYQIKGKGAVSLGKVSIHVKGAAPMAPTALSTRPGVKRATVAWGLPAYSGGAPILKYVVTATSSGQKAKKVEVKANTTAFKSRKIYLTGLAAPKSWQVSVVAVTKYGESEKASVFVNVPNK